MKPDDLLCFCFHVTKRKILNHLRLNKPRRVSQLSECGGAGTGCGWCVPYLKKCFQQHQDATGNTTEEPTAEEYAAGRTAYIQAGHGTPPPDTNHRST